MDFWQQLNSVAGLQAQLFAAHVWAFIAFWVVMDAMRRGMKPSTSYWWGAGVFLAGIICLPLYFFSRPRLANAPASPETSPAGAPVPCRYCEGMNPPNTVYCAHCQKQLRGVDDIISNPKR